MPPSPPPLSPSSLIARFLRSNNYPQTLAAFIQEAGLPQDVGSFSGKATENWTLEKIIEEKKAFDKSLDSERAGGVGGEEEDGWKVPAPSISSTVETPSASNLLSVSVQPWKSTSKDEEAKKLPSIIATGADRRLNILDVTANHPLSATYATLADSPILSCVSIHDGAYLAVTTMSGQLILSQGSRIIDSRKDHTKYAISVVTFQEESRTWLATAGWDSRIYIYCIATIPGPEAEPSIGEPLAIIKPATIPECILFLRNPDSGELLLLASRRDSTNLYYYLIDSPSNRLTLAGDNNDNAGPPELTLLGKQNLAPHSNAWVAFSPACFALSPRDPTLLAVATSTLPHMKLMIVRLLIPSSPPAPSLEPIQTGEVSQATQAFAALAIQNREDAAIVVQVNTMAPQTSYSVPQVVWRPDGSGVWVNGDDGVVRGIEGKTGKLVVSLKGGHEAGTKVRSIWAGMVKVREGQDGDGMEEWVVSGGFDKRLIVWKAHG
ncbi:hypothetical protein FQN53_002987 [Emmonsiellopsis sp. PD_33]|nr:hypothetical protein FQN53_002987 [Emmonsiellopsis sp. PD_33]